MTQELRSLDQILALPDGGDFLANLLAENSTLISDMQLHQLANGGAPSGEMVIRVKYTLDRRRALTISTSVDFKTPKDPPAHAVAWVTSDGHITTENPDQMRMDLRDVQRTAAPIRDVSNP